MEKVDLQEDGRGPSISPADVYNRLSKPLGTEDLAINYAELEPGGQLGLDYHRHRDQEELFVVTSGTVTFETEAGDVAVGENEAIRFAPDEFQLAHNADDERATLLALGAPRGSREIQYQRNCPTCGEETLQELELNRETGVFEGICTECGEVAIEVEPS
ncbi:cupin 2 barrel domain-containing protein [Halovivax asiaticus JCM 14624]|uniref:Cupin 2 barrel domain-containing protein n=1 Tax=Halovivax asiaticus JCM 14624 TaxID=1227490 RepID=M0BGB1_9EURY|nr:cupin domain-containing protein [Halovivax asiaticus]ELZ09338.1 cupin 2 barrel domain-containing protein [Halovivax asiaticus JCM 14624]